MKQSSMTETSENGIVPLLRELGNERVRQLGLRISGEEAFRYALEGFMHDAGVQEIVWERMRPDRDEKSYISEAFREHRPVYFPWMRVSGRGRIYPPDLQGISAVEVYIEDGEVYVASPLRVYAIGSEKGTDMTAMQNAAIREYRSLCSFTGCESLLVIE